MKSKRFYGFGDYVGKQVRERNEYFLWFVKELHNECQVMWKAWHMVQARALWDSLRIQPVRPGPRGAKQHTWQTPRSKWRMISLFLLVIVWLGFFSPQIHPEIHKLRAFTFPFRVYHSELRAMNVFLVFAVSFLFVTVFLENICLHSKEDRRGGRDWWSGTNFTISSHPWTQFAPELLQVEFHLQWWWGQTIPMMPHWFTMSSN